MRKLSLYDYYYINVCHLLCNVKNARVGDKTSIIPELTASHETANNVTKENYFSYKNKTAAVETIKPTYFFYSEQNRPKFTIKTHQLIISTNKIN